MSALGSKDLDDNTKHALKDRIRQLEFEKYADEGEVQTRLKTFIDTHSANLSQDDINFVTLFVESYSPHKKEITKLSTEVQKSAKKLEVVGKYCRTLETQNNSLKSWKEQVDTSVTEVKSKIALYVEENSVLVEENRKLRDALTKALEYDQKRAQHLKLLQETTDFYRANHEEVDRQFTAMVDELSKENDSLKKRLRQQVQENSTLKETTHLLHKKLKTDDEAKKIVEEFEKKYKVILEDNTKVIEQYKTLNDKLKKQNDSLRKHNAQTKIKSEKTKEEMKTMKKTNHKLDKRVTALGNLCRDLQARLKEATRAQNDSEQTSTDETNV